jgi:hypothetical protein
VETPIISPCNIIQSNLITRRKNDCCLCELQMCAFCLFPCLWWHCNCWGLL